MPLFKKYEPPRPLLELKMSPSVNKTELCLGDEIRGQLEVKSGTEIDIEEIWLELRCIESKKKISRYQEVIDDNLVWQEEEYWDEDDIYNGDFSHLSLSGNTHANVGFDKKFPFMVKIPSYGRETYHSVDHTIIWSLNYYLKVRGFEKNFRSKGGGEIFVTKPSVSDKEVVREVVLIPCAYCGGLMPQTSTFCPNCGARRKG